MNATIEPKFTVSDLERQANELHASGKMPSLEDVLKAVAEAREKYSDKIKAARNEHAGIDALGK